MKLDLLLEGKQPDVLQHGGVRKTSKICLKIVMRRSARWLSGVRCAGVAQEKQETHRIENEAGEMK